MKYIDSINLIMLNSALHVDVGDAILMGDLEEYSCKVAGSDKKIYKSLDKELEELSNGSNNGGNNGVNIDNKNSNGNNGGFLSVASASPSKSASLSMSPFGPLSCSTSRKTMIYLIQTLNASFPDYDFTDSKPEQFRKEPNVNLVINSINSTLTTYIPNFYAEFEPKLWKTLEGEIGLQKCDIYSYIPESGDPFTENGVIFSFNYFFYNKSLKKIIFFKCRHISKLQILNDIDSLGTKEELPDQDEIDEYYTEYYDEDATVDMEMN